MASRPKLDIIMGYLIAKGDCNHLCTPFKKYELLESGNFGFIINDINDAYIIYSKDFERNIIDTVLLDLQFYTEEQWREKQINDVI